MRINRLMAVAIAFTLAVALATILALVLIKMLVSKKDRMMSAAYGPTPASILTALQAAIAMAISASVR